MVTRERPRRRRVLRRSRRIDGVDAAAGDAPSETSLLAVPTFGPPIYTARPNQWGVEYLV